jgi:hypothetical protein
MSRKIAKKEDFGNALDTFLGFTLKTIIGIHDPHIQ